MQDTYDVSIKNDQKEVTLVKEEDRYLYYQFPVKGSLKGDKGERGLVDNGTYDKL